jgi:hypothetical protein
MNFLKFGTAIQNLLSAEKKIKRFSKIAKSDY